MNHFYSRIPEAALERQFDGYVYALIPHRIDHAKAVITTDYTEPLMMRFNDRSESFVRNGEAYVLFAKRGDALPMPVHIPYGVTVVNVPDQL